ncbi:DUF2955 domain-containing protein [Halomonas sp. V046]|uniref:DUF2955 domain-containing protein n=1 Tax=Halomonas sp. V046 TaxID=3459611 RepID=UPI004043BCF0
MSTEATSTEATSTEATGPAAVVGATPASSSHGLVGLLRRRAKRRLAVGASPVRFSANDYRQSLRITFGALIGFVVSQLMGWNYGVFFTVFPMFLLGMVPVLNAHVVRQFLGNACLNVVEISLVVGLTQHLPAVMTVLAFAMFYGRFRLMAKGPWFLFGANGVLTLSIMLHFASYPTLDLFDLLTSNVVASVLAVGIAYLMHAIFPDVAPRPRPQPQPKSLSLQRHQTLMGAITATLSFAVFQSLDLRDSLSAQMATILILFALGYHGARASAQRRAIGTLLGCNLALVLQLILSTQSDHLMLVVSSYLIGLLLFAREHVIEGAGSGIGFGGLTTLGILFGQYLGPNQDLVYDAFYRFSSMCVALMATLVVMAVLHRLLNAWAPTRATD